MRINKILILQALFGFLLMGIFVVGSEMQWRYNPYTAKQDFWMSYNESDFVNSSNGVMNNNLDMNGYNITNVNYTCYNPACTSRIYDNGSSLILERV